MLRNVPILALAVTVSVAAIVLSAKRLDPAPDRPSGKVVGTDAWFV
ncbi:MAG: hypothetical protein R6X22_09780 [Gemmatimonadota bacterium]|jgi:hypothetical protein